MASRIASWGFVIIIVGLVMSLLAGIVLMAGIPAWLQWVGFFIAGVGVIMEIPDWLQRRIGGAKLMVEFERIVREEKRALAIGMKNPPLGDASTGKKSIWRRIGVKRETVKSLVVSFGISEVGTGKVVIPAMNARIYSAADSSGQGNWLVTLPPTLRFETSVIVALWNENGKVAIVPGDNDRTQVELPKGVYRIDATFVVDGEPQKRSREFIVGDTTDNLTWREISCS
jgi:hypothetical protein